MPSHEHRCDGCGREETVHHRLSESPEWPECCGETMPRFFESAHRTGIFEKPIEMLSVALNHEDEISGFRRRNPGVEISHDRENPNFGVPIAHTRREKMSILKNERFEERN
ncbi:hypothetical protein LCGC14_1529720 [marine sediment metagenome]|uniref:Uncharacterized protein n=1 Tax=marine sediment metagenome TaxID=412755 RepID=A0A0F9IW60_9ZZZZ